MTYVKSPLCDEGLAEVFSLGGTTWGLPHSASVELSCWGPSGKCAMSSAGPWSWRTSVALPLYARFDLALLWSFSDAHILLVLHIQGILPMSLQNPVHRRDWNVLDVWNLAHRIPGCMHHAAIFLAHCVSPWHSKNWSNLIWTEV